jgi:asparagine synthase (glutamine-hydrolysing)
MTAVLLHRGPDDEGTWVDEEVGLGLGHRRLSILDLSETGHQPMCSESGRFVAVLNGEVYNFRELRRELVGRGVAFRGTSDTEVLIEAIECWGVEVALKRFVGMFAFALWDRLQRELYLVRDRVGIKPLYYGLLEDSVVFASELKALVAFQERPLVLNEEALPSFLRHGYVPSPHSIYRDVWKLPPGCWLRVRESGTWEVARYWDLPAIAAASAEAAPVDDAEVAVEALESLLTDVVRMHLVSDVPLGAFLSGGIDSSTVVALMQRQVDRPVNTYSIGFAEPAFNEATCAKEVARYLGVDHHEMYLGPSEVLSLVPRLVQMYDEPLADHSQIPTFAVSEFARRDVTVALSGDGGDELFLGYNHYAIADRFEAINRIVPRSVRSAGARGLAALASLLAPPASLLGGHRVGKVRRKIDRAAQLLSADRRRLYVSAVSHLDDPNRLLSHPCAAESEMEYLYGALQFATGWQRMGLTDILMYLPDALLTKVDRASMAVGLEVRVPLLDHRIVEWSSRVSETVKRGNRERKWLLRQVLYRHVPRPLVDRPKKGFSVPVGSWLRGPLREWAEEFLSRARLADSGVFDPIPTRRLWNEHVQGLNDWGLVLWNVVTFQAWYARWRPERR